MASRNDRPWSRTISSTIRPIPAPDYASELAQLLPAHVQQLSQTWQRALQPASAAERPGPSYDAAWIDAGADAFYFQDDHGPRFKPNPYFAHWVEPELITPGSRLLIQPGHKPRLFILQPADYWHAPAPSAQHLAEAFDIVSCGSETELLDACTASLRDGVHYAQIGPEDTGNEQLGERNPEGLLNYLHFQRATKTQYELTAMRAASDMGAAGHLAARDAFYGGGTEFDIHMAYLAASRQTDHDVPYGNIVALNEHASVLHYQFQDRVHHGPSRSLLIDAGGQYRGFASDITRTYAAHDQPAFAELIHLMQTHQQQLIDSVRPGLRFADLHHQMHTQLAGVLADAGLITCSAEAALETGMTEKFCPHGLGHLLGLQVHDVGGHLAGADGSTEPPPDNYPALRFTRQMQTGYVFTIEPGLYFIPMLLDELRAAHADVNWGKVTQLQGCGGIRIEDNVVVLDEGIENLTADAFERLTS